MKKRCPATTDIDYFLRMGETQNTGASIKRAIKSFKNEISPRKYLILIMTKSEVDEEDVAAVRELTKEILVNEDILGTSIDGTVIPCLIDTNNDKLYYRGNERNLFSSYHDGIKILKRLTRKE